MVFFTCNGCGEAVKKQQVDKHRQRCRRSHVLSCMDCGTDFRGSEYNGHVKCVTEREKYSGGNIQEKETKGEVKQQSWIDQIQRAIDQAKPTNFSLRRLLESLKGYTNIPRKQAKFKKFLSNSLGVRNEGLVDDAWAAISASSKDEQPSGDHNNKDKEDVENGSAEQETTSKRPLQEEAEAMTENKRQKMEEKNEQKEENAESVETNGLTSQKLSKKRFKAAVKSILSEKPEGKMKLRKLRKAVAKSLSADGAPEEDILAYVDELIPKCKRFIVEGKYISIASRS